MQTNSPQQQADRYSIGKSSDYLGVSIDTLRRWEKKGVITAYRSPGGHRYFLKRDLDMLFGQKYTRTLPSKPKQEPLPSTKPQTISQDITSTPQPPVQAVREEPVSSQPPIKEEISPKPPEPTAIQQRQDLEIKARELIRTPSPTSTPTPEKKKSIKINFGELPWSKILLIGIVLFVIADLILLAVYLTSSRPLVSPIP